MPDEPSAPTPNGGAPIPFPDGSGEPDDGDEFARIPPPPLRRSPLVALAVLAVGAVLLAHLAPDTRYALRSETPIELGEARRIAFARLQDNTFVAVSGLPDYRNALLFEPKGDNYRRAFYRLLGTGDRLLVRADETATRHDLGERTVGRLRRFEALPWADQVRDYYAKQVKASRELDVQALRRALVAKQQNPSVTDRAGEPVVLRSSNELTVVARAPGAVLAILSKDKFPVEEDARHELSRLLGRPVAAGADAKEGYVYHVDAGADPRARDALLEKLERAGIAFRADRPTFRARFDALGGDDGALLLDGGRTRIPWSDVESVQLAAPVEIPADAWIVVENERPHDFAWAPPLVALLVLFMAFNGWLLTRSLGGRRSATS